MKNLKKVISVTFFVVFFLGLSAQKNEIRFCSVKQNATPNANKINKALGESAYVVKKDDIINVVMSPSMETNLPFCRLKAGEIVVLDSKNKITRVLNCGNAVTSYFWNKKKEESSDVIDDNKGNSSDAIDIKKRKIVTRSKNTTINNGSSSGSGGCTSGIRLQDYNNNPVNGGSFGSGNSGTDFGGYSDCDKSIAKQYSNQDLSLMFANSQTYSGVKRFAPNKTIANQYLACKFPTAYKTRKILKVVGIVGGILVTGYGIYKGVKYLKNGYVRPTGPDDPGYDPIPDPTNVDPTGPGGNYFTGEDGGLRINWGG